ncbi:MAG: HAMP domain-containing protein [Chloroflexi bacterium]|nr:HAMP domain-containing protein [Chloroflexota bacterium]
MLVRHWLVKPVELLKSAADAFGAGRLEHTVPLTGRDELAQLARLLDLLQDMLEEVALAVRIGLVEAQTIDQGHYLVEDRRLVDAQAGSIHEVHSGLLGHLGVEPEDLVPDEADQPLTGHAPCPDAPTEVFLGNGIHALRGSVERVLERPVALEDTLEVLLRGLGSEGVVPVDPLDQVEEEQEAELLSIADRVWVAAAVEVVAYLVDASAHLGGHGHS